MIERLERSEAVSGAGSIELTASAQAPARREFLTKGAVLAGIPLLSACASAESGTDAETMARLPRVGREPSGRVLIKGGTIVSLDAKVGDLLKGDILIEGKRIAAIGPSIDAADAADAAVIDASNTIVIPGFVDAHRHAWMAALRGLIPNVDIGRYMVQTHRNLAHHYRPDDIYIGNLMTSLGCLEAGITCILDNSHNSRTAAHSDAAIRGLVDAGIRAVHASGMPRVDAQWDKQWPKDVDRLRKQYFASDDQLVTLGMYADLNPELLAFARDRGLRVATELTAFAAKGLDDLGSRQLLGPWITFNHCSGVPESGWRYLRDSGAMVNICARSDAQYLIAEGLSPLQKALDHGLKPGLSVDGETSYSTSMFTEMTVVYMMQRAMAANRRFAKDDKAPAPITVRDVLGYATLNGAACAGLERKIGSLAPGKEADMILIRTDAGNTYPLNHAVATVVTFAEIANVDTVIVGGRVRKFRGKMLDVDLPRLRRELDASRAAIFERAGYKLDIFSNT